MNTVEARELTGVLNRVKSWSLELRITLARCILETLERTTVTTQSQTNRSVRSLIGIGAGDSPPPDDEAVRQWIEEHRMEKYG
jgi:hypothetical protein